MVEFTEKADGLVLTVRVIPRASKSEIVGDYGGALKVRISSPPVDGAANAELIKIFAKTFDVSKNQIEILSGQTSKTKQVKIHGVSSESLQRFL